MSLSEKTTEQRWQFGSNGNPRRMSEVQQVAEAARYRTLASPSLASSSYRDGDFVLEPTMEPDVTFSYVDNVCDSSFRYKRNATLVRDINGKRIPRMRVCLFGGLRVYIDGERVPDACWTKGKSKTMLAHLVTKFGREVSRDFLLTVLWPEMEVRKAIDNFYVVWSALRRALRNQLGSSPYIRSSGTLYSIDSDLVESDVQEFDILVREVLFGRHNEQGLEEIFVRMDEVYIGDLLAGLKCDSVLLRLRSRYRDTYVDALLSGTRAMMEMDNGAAALWFARKAISLDSHREDVYQTLMLAQAFNGQRTAAMNTFFLCKEHLDKELGIEVSRRTSDIYERLLQDNI